MIYLLKTHVSWVLLANERVDLVHGYLALHIELDLWLNVLIVNVRSLSNVKLMCVMHHHSSWSYELLLVLSPLEPYLHRAVEVTLISQLETLVYLPKLSDVPLGTAKRKSYHYTGIVSLSVTKLELNLVPLSKVIVGEECIVLSREFNWEGWQVYIVIFP